MWNPKQEGLPRGELEQLQWERLQSTLNRVYRHVSFYRKCFDDLGILPQDLEGIRDLARLPFTDRTTLMENYPYGMFAVPLREVVRIHLIPGWTGKPIVTGYTRNDLDHWSDLVARLLHGCGVTPDDVVQISFGYGMLNRGLGFQYGAERLGASVIPGSSEEIRKQILIMRDFRTTVMVCSPSHAQYLLAQMQEMGVGPKEFLLRVGLFGGEPWEASMRSDFELGFLLDAFDHYALPEVMGPGIAGECSQKDGLHIAEDHFLPEIVEPETGRPLPPGAEGELVLTTLTREAFPLIRFRTGDVTRLVREPCACGRTLARISPLKPREHDLVRVNGVPVSLRRIRDILEELYGQAPCYQVVVDREQGEDRIQLWLEMRQKPFDDEMKRIEALRGKITERLREALRVKVHLSLLEHRSLAEATQKQGVLVDKRARPK